MMESLTSRSMDEIIKRITLKVGVEDATDQNTTLNTKDSTNGKVHQLKTLSEALDDFMRNSVPDEYANAIPENVPQLNGFSADSGYGVCFRGNAGIGKTYAATALARMILSGIPPNVSRVTGELFFNKGFFQWHSTPYLLAQVRDALFSNEKDKETELQIINRVSDCAVLLLDDVGAEKTTEFTGATLYTILSRRRNYRRMTIVTTNQTIGEIREWEPRIASRISEMQRIELPNRDRRIRK